MGGGGGVSMFKRGGFAGRGVYGGRGVKGRGGLWG